MVIANANPLANARTASAAIPPRYTRADLAWCLRHARAPRLRTMREFAEQEIVIPDGPFEGQRFRVDRQPYTGLWFAAIASALFNRFVATGPTQSGKTLCAFVIPILYHLFEIGETVVCGVPDMDMAGDKWREDILPVIRRSRFADLLPRRGGGSRGGKVESITFGNGATLKFMSGGGGDKSRAGFTSRVLVVTEIDGMDESGGTSREADKITQMEGRTRAYAGRKRIYLECTVSVKEGRTWREYQAGTTSRIVLPCPHCRAWVTPEREHFHGWQDADDEIQAGKLARFHCPDCGAAWTDRQRRDANLAGRLVHRGQQIDATGQVSGDFPATRTLGFRWSAVNNLFVTAADIGADEHKASQAEDEDNAEREMRQFVWALYYRPPIWDDTPLDAKKVCRRFAAAGKGFVPADAEYLTTAIDLHKRIGWWSTLAWFPGGGGHVVDYGSFEIPSDSMGVERAMLAALRDFRDEVIEPGWATSAGDARVPGRVLLDARYQGEVVYRFVRESGRRYLPAMGHGATQHGSTRYQKPKKKQKTILHIGEEYHIVASPKDRCHILHADADHWKSWIHQRLSTPVLDADGIRRPGAMTFYHSTNKNEHITITKHVTAEKQVEEFVPGRGTVTKWVQEHRQNHLGDTLYNNAVAGHLCGVRLIAEKKPEPATAAGHGTPITMPDGRPYLITER